MIDDDGPAFLFFVSGSFSNCRGLDPMSKLLVDCFKIAITFGDVVASGYSL